MLEVFNGGFRREVVAGLRVDRLAWTNDARTIMATVETEKTARAKTDQVPMCHYMKHLLEFYEQRVRPVLIGPGVVAPLSFWISSRGQPLEYYSYTKGLQAISQEFHPLLRLSSLSHRRAFIQRSTPGR